MDSKAAYMKAVNALIDRFEFLQNSGVYFVSAAHAAPLTAHTIEGFGGRRAGLVILTDDAAAEDKVPYAGAFGGLLSDIISAMKFSREEVFVVSGVRDAAAPSLRSYLEKELSSLAPKAIVAFGAASAAALADNTLPGAASFFTWNGIRVMQAPSLGEMLENKDLKRKAWAGLQAVMREFGKNPA